MISTKVISEIREKTGAGIMNCKEALEYSKGDLEKAIEYLKRKGISLAEKKAGRVAGAGTVFSYIHMEGKVGCLVEVNCETDFVARTDDFKELVKDIAMQITAMNPLYVKRDDIPDDVIKREMEIYRNEALKSGKPQNVIDKIVQGKLEKFYKDICLLEQQFIKDDKILVKDLVLQKIAKIGENIIIKRFARYKLGEK
ncbi:MAG: translation elongation factor Ts [Candidatus Firestonebacteria bacterium]